VLTKKKKERKVARRFFCQCAKQVMPSKKKQKQKTCDRDDEHLTKEIKKNKKLVREMMSI
jgi:hypothetical protein